MSESRIKYIKKSSKHAGPSLRSAILADLCGRDTVIVALRERMAGEKACAFASLASVLGTGCRTELIDAKSGRLDLAGDDGVIIVEAEDRLTTDMVDVLDLAGYTGNCPAFPQGASAGDPLDTTDKPIAYIFRSYTKDVHNRPVLWIAGTPAGIQLAARLLAEGALSAVTSLPKGYPGQPIEIFVSAPHLAGVTGSMGLNHIHVVIRCGDEQFQCGTGWCTNVTPPRVELHYTEGDLTAIGVNGAVKSRGDTFEILRVLTSAPSRWMTIDEIQTEVDGVAATKFRDSRLRTLRARLAEIRKLDERLIQANGHQFQLAADTQIESIKD